jgi:hypothetical protein
VIGALRGLLIVRLVIETKVWGVAPMGDHGLDPQNVDSFSPTIFVDAPRERTGCNVWFITKGRAATLQMFSSNQPLESQL